MSNTKQWLSLEARISLYCTAWRVSLQPKLWAIRDHAQGYPKVAGAACLATKDRG
jgi:hypothetical protein